MDMRLQHHLAQEFYRQQMLQRIPGTCLNQSRTIKKNIEKAKTPSKLGYLLKTLVLATGIHQHEWKNKQKSVLKT